MAANKRIKNCFARLAFSCLLTCDLWACTGEVAHDKARQNSRCVAKYPPTSRISYSVELMAEYLPQKSHCNCVGLTIKNNSRYDLRTFDDSGFHAFKIDVFREGLRVLQKWEKADSPPSEYFGGSYKMVRIASHSQEYYIINLDQHYYLNTKLTYELKVSKLLVGVNGELVPVTASCRISPGADSGTGALSCSVPAAEPGRPAHSTNLTAGT